MKPKKVSIGKPLVSKSNNAKPVKHSVRTHRNDSSSEPSPLKVVGAVLGAVGLTILGGVGSYLYTYYEAASSMVTGVKKMGGKSWEKISSLWKSDVPPDEGLDTKSTQSVKPPVNRQVTVNFGEAFVSTEEPQAGTDLTGISFSGSEKKLMDIKLSEIEELPSQKKVAEILLQKMDELPYPDPKVSSFLKGIVEGEFLEDAVKRFGSSHKLRRNGDTWETLMSNARVALTVFLIRNTNDSALAEGIVEFLFDKKYPGQVIEEKPAGDVLNKGIAVNEPVVRDVVDDELVMPAVVVEDLPGTIPIYSKEIDAGDLNLLEDEYQAFLSYSQADPKLKEFITHVLDCSSNPELHSYSTKKKIAGFLSKKQNDALTEAKRFVKNIAELDINGAEGVMKLFRKALEMEKTGNRYISDCYLKAESMLSLLRQFNRNYPAPNSCKMTIFNPNEIENQDVKLEVRNKTNDEFRNIEYLIKIKSNFRHVFVDCEGIKSFAKRVNSLNLFANLDAPSEGGKEVIPVCVIYGAGEIKANLEWVTKGKRKDDQDSCQALRDLLAIKSKNPKFEIWDINGQSIVKELESLLGPKQELFFDVA